MGMHHQLIANLEGDNEISLYSLDYYILERGMDSDKAKKQWLVV